MCKVVVILDHPGVGHPAVTHGNGSVAVACVECSLCPVCPAAASQCCGKKWQVAAAVRLLVGRGRTWGRWRIRDTHDGLGVVLLMA
jgi:hypothetical protein